MATLDEHMDEVRSNESRSTRDHATHGDAIDSAGGGMQSDS
jgi:hypothetical protein